MKTEREIIIRLSVFLTIFILLIPSIGIAHIIIIPDDCSTIQKGIDLADERDTVSVKYDIYYESLSIDKNILLTRYGTQKPIITSSVGATITIKNTKTAVSGFEIHTSHSYGTGILISNTKYAKIQNCTLSGLFTGICVIQSSVNIERCMFYDNNMGIYFSGNGFVSQVINCTLCRNQTGVYSISKNTKIINSILWDNPNDDLAGLSVINYSCIKNGHAGTSCISKDPLFANPATNDYSLAWNDTLFSPCIDTGNPNPTYNDADGTPADMGAIPVTTHEYFRDDYDGYFYDNIDWVSFPVLNRTTDDWMDAINVLERQYLINDDIYNNDILDTLIYQGLPAVWFYNYSWRTNLTDGEFNSAQGYKFQLKEQYDSVAVQGISGTWLDPDTPITLYPNQENWVGCFLEEPEYFEDAFESIEDEWLTISSEHWYQSRPFRIPPNRTANPGELYIITVDTLCQLVWDDGSGSGSMEAFVKEETEYFSYTETLDYMALNIDTVYTEESVAEIAAYSNNKCLGATKVYDDEYPVQILAYTPEGSKGSGALEFRLYYEGQKSASTQSIPYIAYNSDTEAFSTKPISYKRNTDVRVQLNTDGSSTVPEKLTLLQNYPNPVRTNMTTIRFMPEQNAAHTELSIYNIRGQLIQTIDCDDTISSGTKDIYYSISWDCRDRYGKDVTNGVYFYKLTSGEKSALHKMLLMK